MKNKIFSNFTNSGVAALLKLSLILVLQSGVALAQSVNKNRPTPISESIVSGSFDNAGRGTSETHYYSISAGPGRVSVKITQDPLVPGASLVVNFTGSNCCRGAYDSLLNPAVGRTHVRDINFDVPSRQMLTMRVTGGARLRYEIEFSGAVQVADSDKENFPGEKLNSSGKEVIVPGTSGPRWINTGITVVSGDTVRLDAEGKVDVGAGWGVHGPEGTSKFVKLPPGRYPVESRMRYGLAARITLGSGRKYQPTQTWVYGQAKEMRVTRSGILWLTVNDDAPENNSGEFVVQVTIIKGK